MSKTDYDCIVVGSGPNGLAAAITLQQQGLSVLLVEGKNTIGGGMRTEPLTLPHFLHDVCSAIHPMAVSSPFFKSLDLQSHGLEFIFPDIAAAHPFDDGSAAALHHSVHDTARAFGEDGVVYEKFMHNLIREWGKIKEDALGPLHFPAHPILMMKFGWKALSSAATQVRRFKNKHLRGMWAGMAGHSMQPLSKLTTSAVASVLLLTGQVDGWPIPKGGSNSIANALGSYFLSIGGKIETNFYVQALHQLPSAKAILFDVTPRQLLQIAGHKFSSLYKWQLNRYRYGMGVFKMDWALDGPIPFTAAECRKAGTIHIGNTFEEIALSEKLIYQGKHPDKPFILLAQSSRFDDTRAPTGKETVWGYCHVPHGSTVDMTARIENQIERFAPGFKDLILAKHKMNSVELEAYNPNYIGGDINGGASDLGQLFTRPALRLSPYKTSTKGIYLCSASTPPGGGVHGMCGYHAAKQALKNEFKILI